MADIGEKNYLMNDVAQESTSNEIKDLVQNIKPGDAKESSVQEVLNAVGNVAQQEDVQEVDSAVDNLNNVIADLVTTVNTMKTTLDTLASSGAGNDNSGDNFVDITKLKIHRLTSNANILCNLTGKKRIHQVIIYHANSSDRTLTIQIDGKTSYAIAPRDVYNGVLVWSRVVHNDNFFEVIKNAAESSSIPSAVRPASFDVQNSLKISFDGSNKGLCKIFYEDLS